ncbi:MAG TPA: bifunctional phosphoribosylaminoimidazolecarboxamide formyltransferase/IMP cyclohydrolase, partial [Thermoanaerobaculia bacterium]
MLPARRALVSVFDKTGLDELARGLTRLGIEIVSTGGTLKALQEKKIPVVAVSDVTGFPEILEGRVKTLHPKVHGGILAKRSEQEHLDAIAQHGIGRIDLVVVNLYPFRETVARGASPANTIEMIDVGGPAMVRAAAKNFDGVAVVVEPADYPRVIAALEQGRGVIPEPLRQELALKAFRHTAAYDAAIAEWLGARTPASGVAAGTSPAPATDQGQAFPESQTLGLRREMVLRYGENPHQGGAVYSVAGGSGVLGGFQALQGKELSWNNLLDADAARKMAGLFLEPAVIIVKHNNPCGIGRGADLAAAYRRAVATDPVSAFGSVIALN